MSAGIRSEFGFPEGTLVEKLAQETRVAAEIVEGMLREEFVKLSEGARITQFIDVLATSRVKAKLRKLDRKH